MHLGLSGDHKEINSRDQSVVILKNIVRLFSEHECLKRNVAMSKSTWAEQSIPPSAASDMTACPSACDYDIAPPNGLARQPSVT